MPKHVMFPGPDDCGMEVRGLAADLTRERDALKDRVAELEAKLDGACRFLGALSRLSGRKVEGLRAQSGAPDSVSTTQKGSTDDEHVGIHGGASSPDGYPGYDRGRDDRVRDPDRDVDAQVGPDPWPRCIFSDCTKPHSMFCEDHVSPETRHRPSEAVNLDELPEPEAAGPCPHEDGDPPVGSRLWRCEQELGKARARLFVIKSMVTEAPFPKGMYLIDKGYVDVINVDPPKRAVEDGPSAAGVQRTNEGRPMFPRTDKAEPRFFIDHGTIHDRVTGKHVQTGLDDDDEDGTAKTCALLNELSTQRPETSLSTDGPRPSIPDECCLDDLAKRDDCPLHGFGMSRPETAMRWVVTWEPPINKGTVVRIFDTHEAAEKFLQESLLSTGWRMNPKLLCADETKWREAMPTGSEGT